MHACMLACRYVTRKGQGGRQSTQDKTGKYAKSMGSQLRRHNEASLEREVLDTLSAWAPDLDKCDLIFVHAPAANAKAVFGQGGLRKGDAKVRRIPFTTSRPTLTEVKRCLTRLAGVEELEERPEEARAARSGTGSTISKSKIHERGEVNLQSTFGPRLHLDNAAWQAAGCRL
jgi:hypothetical protein